MPFAAYAQPSVTRSVKGLKLKVSSNGRYLETREGKPFFYLGDTAWTLFKRLNREPHHKTHAYCYKFIRRKRAIFVCRLTKGMTCAFDYLLYLTPSPSRYQVFNRTVFVNLH